METKPIDRNRLHEVLELRRSESGGIRPNITSLSELLGYSNVTNFRKPLRDGIIRSDYLDKIAVYLNVSPAYLSGEVGLLNGKIPCYLDYLGIGKLEDHTEKHEIHDTTKALIKYQGGDPEQFTDYQISQLTLRIAAIVNDFIATGDAFSGYKTVQTIIHKAPNNEEGGENDGR